jgi:hypothetical protein
VHEREKKGRASPKRKYQKKLKDAVERRRSQSPSRSRGGADGEGTPKPRRRQRTRSRSRSHGDERNGVGKARLLEENWEKKN